MLLLAELNITWYLVPLALAISLVYSASRYELPERIARRAAKLFAQILLIMGVVFVMLWGLSFGL